MIPDSINVDSKKTSVLAFFMFMFSIVFLVVMFSALVISILSSSSLQNLECDKISQIIISPAFEKYDLLSEKVLIQNRAEILNYCDSIKASYISKSNHPNLLWKCKVVIVHKNKELLINASNTDKGFFMSYKIWKFYSMKTIKSDTLADLILASVGKSVKNK